MKRTRTRLLALLLVLTVSLCAFTVPATATARTLAINDTVIGTSGTAFTDLMLGSTLYLPVDIFHDYLGSQYSYDGISDTLTVTRGSKAVYFNLTNGTALDSDNTQYNVSAFWNSGVFMVPARFTANLLGLQYASINGGLFIRIFSSYESKLTTNDLYLSTLPTTPDTPNEPTEPSVDTSALRTLFFAFEGLPGTTTLEKLLSTLHMTGKQAAFFVTAEQVQSNPAGAVDLIVAHQQIGLMADESLFSLPTDQLLAALEEANRQLYSTAFVTTRLVGVFFAPRSDLDQEKLSALTDAGYLVLTTPLTAQDLSSSTLSSYNIAQAYRKTLVTLQGKVIVPFGTTTRSVSAAQSLITAMQQAGRTAYGTLDDLFSLK